MGMTTPAPQPDAPPPGPASEPVSRPASVSARGSAPESSRPAAPVQVTGRCQGCGACLLTCPVHAIRPRAGWAAGRDAPLNVVPALCTGCGECLEVCPVDAIEEVE